MQDIIVEGDVTNSGGVVLRGSPFTDIDGKPVARLTDPVLCPRHGSTTILTGDTTFIVDGQPVARHGDKTACGCTLIAGSQRRVFVDYGLAAAPAAKAPDQSTVAEPMSLADSSCQRSTTSSNAAPNKARDVIQVSHQALMDANAYRPYTTEIEAAKEWRKHVLPVANSPEFQVEVGTLITQAGPGDFRLGAPYSSGDYDRIHGLIENAPRSAGTLSAAIHTHPHPGGWIGADRALVYEQEIDDEGVGGYSGEGDVQAGDLTAGYHHRINMYIADADGLHGWNFSEYVELQRTDRAKPFRLGDVYRERL